MIIDMHAHTAEHSSCSHVKAVELVKAAFQKRLHGVVITDHHYLWTADAIDRLRAAAGVPDHFLILSGQEVRTLEIGDVLIFAADAALPPGASLQEIRTLFPDAALVWAHPYRDGKQPAPENLLHPLIDGVEIFNAHHSLGENMAGIRDWRRYRFTAVGGSDIHLKATAGSYTTIFDHPLQNVEELAAQIRRGCCRPFFRKIFSCTGLNVRMKREGRKAESDESRKTRTQTHPGKWGSAERAYGVIGELVRHGFTRGRHRVPGPLGHESSAPVLREEGVPAKLLYDLLLLSDDGADSRFHLNLAASWLARLHSCGLQITPPQEFLLREKQRLASFVEYFKHLKHPQTHRMENLCAEALILENTFFSGNLRDFVQGHGDYHLRSILIGQDDPEDPDSVYAEALGFDNSLCMPCAFDVGTFLAHYREQLYGYPKVLERAPESLFLYRYLAERGESASFLLEVELFTARTYLAIAHQILKAGRGNSDDLHRVLLEAESSLTAIAMAG